MSEVTFRKFITAKLARPTITLAAWALVPISAMVARKLDAFGFLAIEGRCRGLIKHCGQDNIALAYGVMIVFFAVLAGIVSWACSEWPNWTEEFSEKSTQKKKDPAPADWK